MKENNTLKIRRNNVVITPGDADNTTTDCMLPVHPTKKCHKE